MAPSGIQAANGENKHQLAASGRNRSTRLLNVRHFKEFAMHMDTLIFFADVSLDFGLIGIDEYRERIQVALWLSEDGENTREDPRLPVTEGRKSDEDRGDLGTNYAMNSQRSGTSIDNTEQPRILEFIGLSVWYFTGSDPDSYPSVPHGHYQSAKRPWPKLNPYIGRVFSSKHQEDLSSRLTKKEMRNLWSDESFKDYCRKHIMWYMESHAYYNFPVRHPLRLPRW